MRYKKNYVGKAIFLRWRKIFCIKIYILKRILQCNYNHRSVRSKLATQINENFITLIKYISETDSSLKISSFPLKSRHIPIAMRKISTKRVSGSR